jgi:hypothetical protein
MQVSEFFCTRNMEQSNSSGRAGSNVRVRLFQPGSSDSPGEEGVENEMQANMFDARSSSDVEMLLSDSEMVPEDSRRESTVDGVDSASVPPSQLRLPAVRSSVIEPHVQINEQQPTDAFGVAESFSGNDTSELDMDSGHLVDAAAFNRSSPGGFADERDPNYATQRPDTLGAITIAEVTQGVTASGVQTRYAGLPSTLRPWIADSAVEGASFADNSSSAPRLGRRTRGAGMDQVELNQRYLLDDDDNGNQSENDEENSDGDTVSDLGDEDDDDNRLRNANQCESTEADQYKMEPEVDQSDGVELPGRGRPLSASSRQEADAGLPNGPARGSQDHAIRVERFGPENCNADSRDVDKAEEDQIPLVRQLSHNGHQSRVVHMNHPNACGPVFEPDGAIRKSTVAQQQPHSQSASTIKVNASLPKTSQNGAASCGIAKPSVVSNDMAASAFKPVSSARALSTQEATVVPGQHAKAPGKLVIMMNAAATRQGKSQHAAGATGRQGIQAQPATKQNSALPVHKMPNDFTASAAVSDPTAVTELYTDQHDNEFASHGVRMQKRTGIPPVGADVRQSSHGLIASRDTEDVRNHYETAGPDMHLDSQSAFMDLAEYTTASAGRNVRAPPVAGTRESPAALGSFIPGDSSSQQATPVRVYTHLPHQLLDDSLEMSPIRPASSTGSQHTSLHALETASSRGDHLNGIEFVPFPNYEHQVSA